MRLYQGPYIEPCRNCRQPRLEWERDHKLQLYCSRKCRLEFYQKQHPVVAKKRRQCLYYRCSRVFLQQRHGQLYCCEKHKIAAQNHRWYIGHKAEMKARVTLRRWRIKVGLLKKRDS